MIELVYPRMGHTLFMKSKSGIWGLRNDLHSIAKVLKAEDFLGYNLMMKCKSKVRRPQIFQVYRVYILSCEIREELQTSVAGVGSETYMYGIRLVEWDLPTISPVCNVAPFTVSTTKSYDYLLSNCCSLFCRYSNLRERLFLHVKQRAWFFHLSVGVCSLSVWMRNISDLGSCTVNLRKSLILYTQYQKK